MLKNERGYGLVGAMIASVIMLSLTYSSTASPMSISALARHVDEAGALPVLQVQATGTTTTTTTTSGGWTLSCTEGGEMPARVCSAELRVMNQENQATVLIWLMGRDAEGQLLAEFVTPTNVMIQPGVTVTIDGEKPIRAEYVYCTANQGCRAKLELPPKLLRTLREAGKVKIGIALVDGRPLEISIELKGIDEVFKGLGA